MTMVVAMDVKGICYYWIRVENKTLYLEFLKDLWIVGTTMEGILSG